ncbi:Flp family type IVb pilin [Aestuariivirga sp.]|uniref:Flp family type IVb pilin n=1 Tax=Aestuariivirga sp. TaxID=2650926 RepID=UPI0039194124
MKALVRFAREDSGATAIEYSLIAGAMFIAIAATLPQLASSIQQKFSAISTF